MWRRCQTTSGSDPDLTILAGANTNDKCVLEFDFIPASDTLKFRYVFGSEEFFTFCYEFNDAFGFFLSGPGITGIFSNNSDDIALMPGTSNYVTINNVCNDSTAGWCNKPVNCHTVALMSHLLIQIAPILTAVASISSITDLHGSTPHGISLFPARLTTLSSL